MVEATFYMRARFANEDAAAAAEPKVREFLEQVGQAYDFWQESRGGPAHAFWPVFQQRFPDAYAFLEYQGKAGLDCNNALSGSISFGHRADELQRCGDELLFCETVWHLADWGPLCGYLVKSFGAVAAGWVSDEYLDPYSAIEMDITN